MTSGSGFALAASAVVAGAAGAAYYATYAVRSQWLGPTIWHGDVSRPLVTLTFDDGPSGDTPRILDTLAEHRVPGTFFLIGREVERHRAIVRRIVAEGHEIGNHSWSHPIFLYRSTQQTVDELQRAQQVIADVSGTSPRWCRPPCGVRTPAFMCIARGMGLDVIQWTVAGFDWKPRSSDQIVRSVLGGAGPGTIVLLHDGDSTGRADRAATVAALPTIIHQLEARDLRPVSLPALLSRTGDLAADSVHA